MKKMKYVGMSTHSDVISKEFLGKLFRFDIFVYAIQKKIISNRKKCLKMQLHQLKGKSLSQNYSIFF